jgi:DNA-binding transcriptional MerR regulator
MTSRWRQGQATVADTTSSEGVRMRIGELAEATGATVRAIRYYEEQGLLRPERTASGQRVYTQDAVDQVVWIRNLLRNGLPSRAIAKLRRCDSADEVTPEQRAVIYEEHARIEAEYRAIAATKERLDSVLAFIGDGPGHPG